MRDSPHCGRASACLTPSKTGGRQGSVPENVNFALKSSLLLAFLESVPSLVGRLKPPPTTLKTMQQVAAELEEATALILAC